MRSWVNQNLNADDRDQDNDLKIVLETVSRSIHDSRLDITGAHGNRNDEHENKGEDNNAGTQNRRLRTKSYKY